MVPRRDNSVRSRGCDNSSAVFRTISRPQVVFSHISWSCLTWPTVLSRQSPECNYVLHPIRMGVRVCDLPTFGFFSRWDPLHVHFAPSHEHFFPSLGRFFRVFGLDFRKIFVRVSSLGNTPLSLSCRGYTASAIDSKLLYGLHRANPFLQLLE